MSCFTHTNAHIPFRWVACQATLQSGPMPNSLRRTSSPVEPSKLQKRFDAFHFAARNSPKKFRWSRTRRVCARVCVTGSRVFPGGLNPDGACDFHRVFHQARLTEVTPLVSQAQQSHCAWAQTDCLYQPSETFHFSLSAILRDNFGTCRDFSSPNKRVKINRRVVEALYWDGIIPFTSLNGAGGQSNQGAGNVVIPGDFHRF